ncbi:hypothetical protein [Hymenobacter sp. B1770]|uniref:hypothetical protein n=1 Tax=Hymenobacter sp. B1770 TaxID=1718788 RepID=UPI003CF9392B
MTYLLKGRVRFSFVAAVPCALLVAVLLGCTDPPPSVPGELGTRSQDSSSRADTVALRYTVLGADCGLFPAAARLLTDEQGNAPPHLDRFTPTLPQAARVELALRTLPLHRVPVLAGYRILPNYPLLIHQNLHRYKRQYFGFYNLQRQPCFYVHFFAATVEEHPGYTPQWLREAFQVVDGGAAFWSIKYNWTTHQFYDFEANSEG